MLAGEKQRINRAYDFPEVVRWFAHKCDRILVLFDAHKLDISDEFKATIEARGEGSRSVALRPTARRVSEDADDSSRALALLRTALREATVMLEATAVVRAAMRAPSCKPGASKRKAPGTASKAHRTTLKEQRAA